MTARMAMAMLLLAIVAWGQPGMERFQLAIESEVRFTPEIGFTDIKAQSICKYALQKNEQKVVLYIESLEVSVCVDGTSTMRTKVDKNGIYSFENGRWVIPPHALPRKVQEQLEDCYAKPICEIILDERGRELERKIVAAPLARPLIEQGMIANTRLFHVMFLPELPKWECSNEISMGYGAYARGILSYEKMPVSLQENRVRVAVRGTLIGDVETEGMSFRNAVYEVEGEQVYDLVLREWRSGELAVDIKFDIFVYGQASGHATGAMKITMENITDRERRRQHLRRRIAEALKEPLLLTPISGEERK